jgi:hypothetical protein
MKTFDLEKVYDEQVAPLMAQVIQICRDNELPFVADFLYKNDEEDGEQYCTSTFIPAAKTHGKSEHMEALWDVVKPRRSPSALHMRISDDKGNVTDSVILG